jgi:hypothetical protein
MVPGPAVHAGVEVTGRARLRAVAADLLVPAERLTLLDRRVAVDNEGPLDARTAPRASRRRQRR